MIAVPPDHVLAILKRVGVERCRVVVILPAGNTIHYQHAQLVARIVKGRVVRVVGAADKIHARILQPLHVVINGAIRHGVSLAVNILMKVGAPGCELDAIDQQPVVVRPLYRPDPNLRLQIIHRRCPLLHHRMQRVKIRIKGVPQIRRGHHQVLVEGIVRGRRNGNRVGGRHHDIAARIRQRGNHRRALGAAILVQYIRLHVHRRRPAGDGGISHENTSPGHFIRIDRIRHVQWIRDVDLYVPIQSAVILKIRIAVAGRKVGVWRAVQPDGDHIVRSAVTDQRGRVHSKWQIPAHMIGGCRPVQGNLGSVYPHIRLLHRCAEFDENFPPDIGIGYREMLPIPAHSEISGRAFGRDKFCGVRQPDAGPGAVIERRELGVGNVTLHIKPVRIEINIHPVVCGRHERGGMNQADAT